MENPLWHPRTSLVVRGRLISLENPLVMGILNVTPDSFYSGSRTPLVEEAVNRAQALLEQGADLLDIGGYSSRPGATDIPAQEEADRVLPVIEAIHRVFPEVPLSIDTFRSSVARQALDAGAGLVNDIAGGDLDAEMWPLIARRQVPYILMHMQGRPADMQVNPRYEDVVTEVLDTFIRKVGALRELGVHDILVDPGFGFGKTLAHNYHLLSQLHTFSILGLPVLAGLSRKSMIWKPLGIKAEQALNGTSALHMVALQQGAQVLRVHDPAPAREVITLFQHLQQFA